MSEVNSFAKGSLTVGLGEKLKSYTWEQFYFQLKAFNLAFFVLLALSPMPELNQS